MTKDTQDNSGSWERKRVERALDYHNRERGTHIIIEGKTQNVRPDLKGKSDWDWVCRDTKTGAEIAVEVKRLTDQELEQKDSIAYRFFSEIADSLTNELEGTFHLRFSIPREFPVIERRNEKKLQSSIRNMMIQKAAELRKGQEVDLIREIQSAIPGISSCELSKINDEDSACHISSSGLIYWQAGEFDEPELKKLEELVSQANTQLQKANTKEAFLLLIESHSAKEPSELQRAFEHIRKSSYSGIRRVYFVEGEEVSEIPLPTS